MFIAALLTIATARTSTFNSSIITNNDPRTWPVAHTVKNNGQGYSLFVNHTT